MQDIFVSYRREDAPDVTGRIFDHLKAAFGEQHLFKDIDSIPLGTDFREVIREAIQRCDVLVVIIGPRWLDAKDEAGRRRLDDPDDYVRLEISSALDRNIPVIPILVGGASVPAQQSLPAPLQRLAFRNALRVRSDPDFRNDTERLCRDLRRFLRVPDPGTKTESRWRGPLLIATAALILIGVLGALFKAVQGPQSISNETVNTMTVNNVGVILQEYKKYQGKPLMDEQLREQIDRAVAAAMEGNHRESVRLLEQISTQAPVPAIFTNLGVEYARLNETARARAAFARAIDKDPTYQPARENQKLLEESLGETQPTPSNPKATAIRFEKSPVPAILLDRLDGSGDALKKVHVVEGGTKLRGTYTSKYSLTPGSPTLVDPGVYDVVFETAGGGTFVLVGGVEVKEGQRVHIDPNPLLGSIFVERLTRSGFPAIKQLTVVEAGTTRSRLVVQRTDTLGVALPIVPGRYDIRGETTEGEQFVLVQDVEVKAREVARIQTDSEVAAVAVHDPGIAGVKIEAIYVLRAGGDDIVAQTKEFGRPMLVLPGVSYDIGFKQPTGMVRTRRNVIAKRGELIDIR